MSEVPATLPPSAESAGPGLLARFLGILTSPRETFAAVVARPQWFGMLAVVIVVGVAGGTALMATETGRTAALEATRTQMESFGISMSGEAGAEMERAIMEAPLWRMALQTTLGQILAGAVVPLVLGGVFFAFFSAMLGGVSTFRQVFCVVVHASPVQVVGSLFSMAVMYAKGSMTGVTNLGVFLPWLDDQSFWAHFAGSIDLVRIWWIVVLSIGLGVLFKRKTGPIATALLAVYAVIAIGWAAFLATRGGA